MPEKSHTWVYIVIIVVIAALMVAGAVTFGQEKNSPEARAKAKDLIAKLNAAGLAAPSEAAAVRLFGADGGRAAERADNALLHAQYAWDRGTSGPASRPVIIDPNFLKAAEIFLSVYAPEKLAGFRQFVNGLDLQETK